MGFPSLNSIVKPRSSPVRCTLSQPQILLRSLFSIPGKPEGFSQVQGGVVQRQPMNGRPQIQHVPLYLTTRFATSKRVLAQMDREGLLPVCRVTMHRTGTAALQADAAQLTQEIEMRKCLL